MLAIRFARISPTHHQFSYARDNGDGESAELETKTYLVHDFIHFCVESEARITDGFYGALERGKTLSAMREEVDGGLHGNALDVERVVGMFTSVAKGNVSIETMMDGLGNLYGAYGEPLPAWLDVAYLERVSDRYRRLMGEWNSLRFGEELTLVFGG